MRYAILSDVHANATALRTVLADAADAHAEKIVCLGDVLGYGPEPVEALELVYRRAHVCLAGNHDDAVSGRFPVEDFTSFAAAAVERHRAALAASALDWLAHLPHTCAFTGPTGAFACAHGDFAHPERFDYVIEPRDAVASWAARGEPLLFVGHTHKPGLFVRGASGAPHALEPMDFVLEPGKRYLVNVGSVGYPRAGEPRSSYCLYDDETGVVSFRTTPFDFEGYRAKMHGQGLDEAPWVRARAEERARGAVRGAEHFGKADRKRPVKRAAPQVIVAPAAPPATAQTTLPARRRALNLPVIAGAFLLAVAGTWCALRLTSAPTATPAPEIVVPDVPPPAAEETVETAPVSPATLGPVVATRRCTVPARDRRVAFAVKMARGGAPVWVHVRFEDAHGAHVGKDVFWFSNVRLSKKSPKRGVPAPEGATAAFLEIVKAHPDDVCTVADMSIAPFPARK